MKYVAGCLFMAVSLIAAAEARLVSQAQNKVDFGRDIQPLLKEYCISCHGPSQQMKGLRLDHRQDAMNIAGRRVIYPGSSAESRLYLLVAGKQPGLQMPPTGALSPAQI